MPVTGDIDIYRGEDVPVDLNVPNAVLTGTTNLMTVKVNRSDAAAVFTVAGVVSGPNDCIFTIPAASTSALAPGPYEYDMCRTDEGYYTVYREGRLNIQQRVAT
jgi:hypothetical protein